MLKKICWLIILSVVFVGCSDIHLSENDSSLKLTPYFTQVEEDETEKTFTQPPIVMDTPMPTPTPITHTVSLGETISSIALQYGVTIDAILIANPEIKPILLIVGDEVIIPFSETIQSAVVNTAIIEKIEISNPNCVELGDGIWCGSVLLNRGQEDVENCIVAFTLLDEDGNIIDERFTPTIMRHLPAGMEMPAAVFLSEIPAGYHSMQVNLVAANPVNADETPYLPTVVEDVKEMVGDLEATISGKMRVEASERDGDVDVWIGATAFDSAGELVGARRLERIASLNELFNFSIAVYSASGSIADVVLYTEAF